jgi:hypothetical protein
LGVNPSALQALADALHDRLGDVAAGLLGSGGLKVVEDVRPPLVPTVTRPPYAGLDTDDSFEAASWARRRRLPEPRFTVTPTHKVHAASGRTETAVRVANSDASEADFVFASSEASVGFFYRTVRNARLRITVTARAVGLAHSMTFMNQFGFSGGFVANVNALRFTCTSPEVGFEGSAQVSLFQKEFDDEGTFSSLPLPPHTKREVVMRTDGAFTPETDVWVEVGCESYQFANVNDLSVDTTVSGIWIIDSVMVAPAS